MVAVVQADAELVLLEAVRSVIAEGRLPTAPQAWTTGTIVQAGVTPDWFVQVRLVGGVSEGHVAERPLLDVRVWADGTFATEAVRSLTARTLLAHIRRLLPCEVFAVPVPIPDPFDTAKVHTLFTVQLLTRGDQIA